LERRKNIKAPKPPAKRQKTTAKSNTSIDTLAITSAAGGDVQTTAGAQQRPPGKKKESRYYDNVQAWKRWSTL
jgi:hypothetical protein